MVPLCVMGWGLVLLENLSAAAVVAAVTAAAVAVGVDAEKVGFCFTNIEYGHFFKGVCFRKYVVHIFKILTISQRRSFEQKPDGKSTNGTLVRVLGYEN